MPFLVVPWENNSRDNRPAYPAEQNIPREQFAGTYVLRYKVDIVFWVSHDSEAS